MYLLIVTQSPYFSSDVAPSTQTTHNKQASATKRKSQICGISETQTWTDFLGDRRKHSPTDQNARMQHKNPAGQTCTYEDALFESRVTEVIEGHPNKDVPLFVFWATHIVHGGLPSIQLVGQSHPAFDVIGKRTQVRSKCQTTNWPNSASFQTSNALCVRVNLSCMTLFVPRDFLISSADLCPS